MMVPNVQFNTRTLDRLISKEGARERRRFRRKARRDWKKASEMPVGATFLAWNPSSAMMPEIPDDALLFVQKVEPEKVVDEQVHVLVYHGKVTIARVQKLGDRLRIIPRLFGPDEINFNELKEAYVVHAYIEPVTLFVSGMFNEAVEVVFL